MLESETGNLTQIARYEQNETRKCYRSSHYDQNLTSYYSEILGVKMGYF